MEWEGEWKGEDEGRRSEGVKIKEEIDEGRGDEGVFIYP
jgi:hypothetical protein